MKKIVRQGSEMNASKFFNNLKKKRIMVQKIMFINHLHVLMIFSFSEDMFS